MPQPLVVPLSEVSAGDRSRVGAKAANLGELLRAGLPVPPGFCVSTEAYRAHLAAHRLGPRIRASLGRMDPADPASVEREAAEIRALVEAASVPPDVAAAIERAYAALGPGVAVAVRSSATAEDLTEASFAGQQDTFLDVEGAAAVVERVRACLASLWTARALTYRAHRGLGREEPEMACLVQRMVAAEVAGVAFTAEPATGDRERVIVEAVDGTGDALVSGRTSAGLWVLSRARGAVLERRPGGLTRRGILEPHLPDLLALSLRIEARFAAPQDVEWALHDGRLSILQARPITTLPAPAVPLADATRPIYGQTLKVREILPNPLSPAAGDVFAEVVFPLTFESLAGEGLMPARLTAAAKAAHVVRGRLYVDVSALRELFLPGLDEETALEILDEGKRPSLRAVRWGAVAALAWKLPATSVRMLRYLGRMERYMRELEEVYGDVLAAWEDPPLEETPWSRLVDILRVRPPRRAAELRRVSTVNPVAAFASTAAFLALGAMVRRWTDEPPEAAASMASGLSGILDVECTKALWDLSRAARAAPEVARLFEEEPRAVLGRLPDTAAAQSWRRAWDAFVARFGHRTSEELDLARPRWREDPAQPLTVIANYLRADPRGDPHAVEGRLRERRVATERRILSGLRWRPVRRAMFRAAARLVRITSLTRQNSKFHMVRGFDLMRRALLEMGRRLVEAGRLERAEDALFLRLAELDTMPADDLRERVALRKAELERWRRDRPARLVDADGRPVREAARTPAAAVASRDGDALRGVGTSPGRVRGRVRVITDVTEGARLDPGDVLVAPFTDPSWTPLFLSARAVVVEVGSLLSHASIVARELGIPSVVAVAGATRRLHDGERVEVDGLAGTVTVLAGGAGTGDEAGADVVGG